MRGTWLVIGVICLTPFLRADGLPNGTYVRRASDGVHSTMIVEAAGSGRKLTFKVDVPGGVTTMVVTTQLDGKDAPVLVDGKPSGETMAIRMVDDRHVVNILKMNGSVVATEKSEVSADGKLIKVETTTPAPGTPNTIEYWDKK
jgi:hypothetical protein